MDRRIKLASISNCRELGGITNREGARIKRGILLRSAHLMQATGEDLTRLKESYGLKEVVDLRTVMEKKEKPDTIPDGVTYTQIPFFQDELLGISHGKSIEEKVRDMEIPRMEDLYAALVSRQDCRQSLARILQAIMTHDFDAGSVLWHCTEGKDRCGLVTAMLLWTLDVPWESICADYLLTNETNEPKADRYYQMILAQDENREKAAFVRNAFVAKESYLQRAFDAILAGYGDRDGFFAKGLGLDGEMIAEFRLRVLE